MTNNTASQNKGVGQTSDDYLKIVRKRIKMGGGGGEGG